MDLRRFIAFISIVVVTSPLADAAALGLGDAELASRLNQPLAVVIEVVGAPADGKRLNATIGTESVRAGELSSRLRAEAFIDREGRAYIRVTTRRAVREPIVSFLLVVESAREHVMREYTFLLDPPGYSLPVSPAPAPEPAVAAPLPPEPEPAVAALPPQEPRARGREKLIGPVARGETLSGLAMANGAVPGVTWAQMTWALFRLNPHAFIDGDINKLRSGVYLEVPSRATVERWSHRQALDLIKAGPAPKQVAAAPAVSEPVENATPPQPEPSAPPPESRPGTPKAVFRVLSPGDPDPARSAGTVGSPVDPRERERLRQLVAEANLQIRDSHHEIMRAREQLADTALQVSTLVETVEKKDSEIKDLENRLSDLREFVKERSAEVAESDATWLQRLIIEVLVLAALVGVLAATLSRWGGVRRRPSDEAGSGAIALELQMPTVGPTESEATAESPEEEPITETDDSEEPTPDHVEYEEIELRGDLLMEANAYLAYGYHDKAKEVLEDFIKENPADAESRLIMLRTLHAIKEKRKFRRHAEALLELLDDEDDERWTEAVRLGKAILPEERLFDSDAHKRAEDEKWEQTVWTGARKGSDDDEHTYLDIDEFKYVDLYLLDAEGAPPDVQDPTTPEAAAEDAPESAQTEADLAKWRAEMLGTKEDRGVRVGPDAPAAGSATVLDDEPLDDPVNLGVGERVDGPIDFSLNDPTESFLDLPPDASSDTPDDDET